MVNVIIPLYYSKDTIQDTLNSLVAQTRKMFFVTLVQDSDGEDYSEIITEYKNRGLHICLLSTKENGGPGVARQVGIDNTKMCDYIMFCDSDDMYYPRAIDLLYTEAKKNCADIVTSTITVEESHGSGNFLVAGEAPVTWCGGKIYRLDFLKQNNIRFLDDIRLNEDSYFNLVVHAVAKKKFQIKEPTYLWRDNKESLTRKNRKDFFEKSAEQYLLSQVRGLKKIYEINGEIDNMTFARAIVNIYYTLMKAKYKEVEISDAAHQELAELAEIDSAALFVKNKKNWKYFTNDLNSHLWLNKDEVFFFDVKFDDFIYSIFGGNNNENLRG